MSKWARAGNSTVFDVCLLSMPYPCLDQPSVALGLLKSALSGAGISATALYPCLWFAEEIGLDVYSLIYESKQEFLLGEWTFAGAAFPDFNPDHEAYLDRVLSAPVSRGLLKKSGFTGSARDALWQARNAASGYIERVTQQVLDLRPKIVGCTSTFAQHCASLAVLRKIRELAPDVITMMGGANCEGRMGLAIKRSFSWVDFVVSGEADLLFPDLCRKVLDNGRDVPLSDLPYGAISAHPSFLSPSAEAPRASVNEMNQAPIPDFTEYFGAVEASRLREYISPGLAMETSRGCWWGKVHHCTFCGLNGGNMEFRSKSPDRVLAELDALSRKHGIRKFNIVDNILDMRYVQDLLPQLAEQGSYSLFFETKANLRREQMKAMADAGIRRLQPGIESMHDEVLRLIDKGVSAIQNVRFLKWARELGIFTGWNFLWDVPGEKDEWYGEMADFLPLIFHLQPPGVDRIQFHRFSPYHQRPQSYGITLAPYSYYSSVYPVGTEELNDIAYYFEIPERPSAKSELDRRPHLRQVMKLIAKWSMAWEQGRESRDESESATPMLWKREEQDGTYISDTRPCAVASDHLLQGLASDVYQSCQDIHSFNGIMKTLASGWDGRVDEESVRKVLAELEERKLVLQLKGQYLALGLSEIQRIPDTIEELPAGYTDLHAWANANPSWDRLSQV